MSQLRVCQLPEKSLTFNNMVYLCPTDRSASMKEYVTINGVLTKISFNPSISPFHIGISALLRTFLNVDIEDLVTTEEADRPLFATNIGIKLEMASKRAITVREEDFCSYIKSSLKSPLYPKLQIALNFQGFTFKAEVTTVFPNSPVIIDDDTLIQIKHTENQYLTWVSSRPRIRPIFNFEELGIGGLDSQFSDIFRRAFTSRMCPPQEVEDLGLRHVKGIVLYGPAGTGKTLIARKIGEILNCRPPKIVNGPEILSKYVGESEDNIRKLFIDAEEDEKRNGINSDLHLIIFDEIDAICKTRGTIKNSTGVGDTIVNQLLTKIDGVNQLNNVLIIAMTNRLDMLDPALLRPGRLEVHIEIPVPNEAGRKQIFQIHTKKLKDSKRLADDVDISELAKITPNLTGAAIEGIVRCAIQAAMYENIGSDKEVSTKGIVVNMSHFKVAIQDSVISH